MVIKRSTLKAYSYKNVKTNIIIQILGWENETGNL
jgi:hypothetical protein